MLRYYNYGLKIFDYNYGPVLDRLAFEELLREKDILLKAADPYIRQLESILINTESIILLSDEQGVMLRVIDGSTGLLAEQNRRFQLEAGSVWTEKTVGTCAHGISLIHGIPVQICGPEHFSEKYEQISCSSAPIFDANSLLAGTLSIVTPSFHHQNSHTLALVISMARAIQSEFQYQLNNELLRITFEASDEAVLTINKRGAIIKANTTARKIFYYLGRELTGMPIEEILGNQPLVNSVLQSGKPVLAADMEINGSKQKILLRSLKPLKNDYGICIGCVLTFKKIDKSKKSGSPVEGGDTRLTFAKIVGNSPQMRQLIHKAKKFAPLDDPILIQGESGTGKEIFAQAIHQESRPNGPFIAVNCAAIPKTLIESELFGYEGGAFTGAERQGRPGKIELANGGTLFLDEIGDMPLELQPVLLRVLEEKQVMRVGGCRSVHLDFRLIAATNKNLSDLVKNKQFREDLYFRLAVFTLVIPPLRERRSDINALLAHFLANTAKKQQVAVPVLSSATKCLLYQYGWPGNVRQLKNTILYALNMSSNGVIKPEDLPDLIRESAAAASQSTEGAGAEQSVNEPAKEPAQSMSEVERDVIRKVLLKKDYCISRAARALVSKQ
ncbi:MAG: sigma 54-interacting transcriptional regulator [Firmicutes bacterium]|nr:sigma 54-interacting transcriptional regulator [Bacillota bacterium]